jgi:hypothetical protein
MAGGFGPHLSTSAKESRLVVGTASDMRADPWSQLNTRARGGETSLTINRGPRAIQTAPRTSDRR